MSQRQSYDEVMASELRAVLEPAEIRVGAVGLVCRAEAAEGSVFVTGRRQFNRFRAVR